VLFVTLLSIPYLDYFDVWNTPLMILHPLQGALIVIKAAFLPVATSELLIGSVAAVAWIATAFALANRAFHRFVVRKEGVR
jgi:hypothetical protein